MTINIEELKYSTCWFVWTAKLQNDGGFKLEVYYYHPFKGNK